MSTDRLNRESDPQSSSEPRLIGSTAVISLRARKAERDREHRRSLVERATVREYAGRSWERDHRPAGAGTLLAGRLEWQPRS